MQSYLRPLFLLFICASTLTGQITLPPDALRQFVPENFEKHLTFLASDEMRGRDTPSPELQRAAEYIAEHFKRIGLEPLGTDFLLPFTLVRPDLDTALESTRMSLTMQGTTRSYILAKDFIPFEQTAERSLADCPITFAGFGITAPEYDYDDYANIDVRGHAVVVLRGEPESTDTSRFRGPAFTRHSLVQEKVRVAVRNGASAVLVVDAVRAARKPLVSGYPWPSLFPKAQRARGVSLPAKGRDSLVVLHIGEAVVETLIGSLDTLRSWIKTIDSTVHPLSRRLRNATLSAAVRLKPDSFTVFNVAGILRGSKLPDEYTVMGAHYDHVGVGKPNADGDSIYNGADDNASGTSSLMVAAEALATSKRRPARSMVFIAFAAEEKGLLGSKAYVQNSPLPIEKCVAMINTDMIGRSVQGKLSIGGAERCPDLIAINEEENTKLTKPFSLAYDIEQYFFRSDQASFAMKRVPVIFYFTGEHKDYHKVTDETPLIDYASLAEISKLATSVMWRAAHRTRSTYVPAGFEE